MCVCVCVFGLIYQIYFSHSFSHSAIQNRKLTGRKQKKTNSKTQTKTVSATAQRERKREKTDINWNIVCYLFFYLAFWVSRKYLNGFWALRQPKIAPMTAYKSHSWRERVSVSKAYDIECICNVRWYCLLFFFLCDVHQFDWVSAFLNLSHSRSSPAIDSIHM